MYQNLHCPFCSKFTDSQEHALACAETQQYLTNGEKEELKYFTYNDLFESIDKQAPATRMYQKLIQIRQKLRTKQNTRAPHGIVVDQLADAHLY